ncbi:MAG: hypothetical protein FOGNACKC_00497 [Anaerolineae bacterium]|nr:hypothetical protein [Anaerolineae bacterium]
MINYVKPAHSKANPHVSPNFDGDGLSGNISVFSSLTAKQFTAAYVGTLQVTPTSLCSY